MKSVTNKLLFALLSLWHCAVSFISPWCIAFNYYCITDINSDEYGASLLFGFVLLFLWLIFFLPSFIYLTLKLKNRKNILAYIPALAFVLIAATSILITILDWQM